MLQGLGHRAHNRQSNPVTAIQFGESLKKALMDFSELAK